jgi:hypothetical protein
VFVLIAGHAAIDARAILATETENAVEARGTAWCSLDAAHALFRHVHALSTVIGTRHVAAASAATGEDALLDRRAIDEAVAPGLDANQTVGAIIGRVAGAIAGARTTEDTGRACGDRTACRSTGAPVASRAAAASRAAVATRTSASLVSTTDYARC